MKKNVLLPLVSILWLSSCQIRSDSTKEMAAELQAIYKKNNVHDNIFSSVARYQYYDSLFKVVDPSNARGTEFLLGEACLEAGKEKQAIQHFQHLLDITPESDSEYRIKVMKKLAIAWFRYGERVNCLNNHDVASCVFPIQGKGIHGDQQGSGKTIAIYEALLKDNPDDLESRWLLNIAYMTIGEYPQGVPKECLLTFPTPDSSLLKPFTDAAVKTGLNTNNISGGSLVEDFDNDGYLDVVSSSMNLADKIRYCRNNGNGTFSDASSISGIDQLTGGMNLMQTDYNNDGYKDIWVIRGAWKGMSGREPNSLLRNNKDGTFTDVTKKSGLFCLYPSHTSTWADFNNDGWLDVVNGNETMHRLLGSPTQLYINNKNGTFTEVSKQAGINIELFVKGTNFGDYNNDGLMDLFVTTFSGRNFLYKNKGADKNNIPQFEEVSAQAGVKENDKRSYTTWFWDVDNDGWLDLLACNYMYNKSLAIYAAQDVMGNFEKGYGHIVLYKNNRDGTFKDVSEEYGLHKAIFVMGSNYGDLDNDGYLDFFVGSGAPEYNSVMPSRLFKNIEGKKFVDVTTLGRVGSLQKGHGISFSDIDNDGDQDIYIDYGGGYEGDYYQNSLYINPGQNNNNWFSLSLKGVKSNTAAIGTRIKVSFKENGVPRSVYRMVSSGSSFGANPLVQHIGIGSATTIESITIKWAGSNVEQVFNNIQPNLFYKLTEGDKQLTKIEGLRKLDFLDENRTTIGCAPLASH